MSNGDAYHFTIHCLECRLGAQFLGEEDEYKAAITNYGRPIEKMTLKPKYINKQSIYYGYVFFKSFLLNSTANAGSILLILLMFIKWPVAYLVAK